MIVRMVAIFSFLCEPAKQTRPAEAMRSAVGLRRKSSRAVWSGIVTLALATMGMAAALETVKPEWRDPEFAVRLEQLRKWKKVSPNRPLVVAFGSSRTQMGLVPTVMGFPDKPGSPIVYNCGYRAAHPLGVWLQFSRVLDAGVKPDAVLIQLAAPELRAAGPAEEQYATWMPRFSLADIRRFRLFTEDPHLFQQGWMASRLALWDTYREAILSDLLPDWQQQRQRIEFVWERTDDYGFSAHPFLAVPDELRASMYDDLRDRHADALAGFAPSDETAAVFREVVGRCREEGIAVAFFWAPESPTYRNMCAPAVRSGMAEYQHHLAAEFGVTVFPDPDYLEEPDFWAPESPTYRLTTAVPDPNRLEEADFADAFHLMRPGAEKYSRWLAENHLKPWLKAQRFRTNGGQP